MNKRTKRLTGWTVVAALTMLALPLLGAELPPGGTFTDDDLNVHEGFIEAIAAAGITRGCNPPANDRYCPSSPVTRGQMAAFLVRALGLPTGGDSPFTDDDASIFEDDITRLAAAGITRGCNPPANDRFCPDDSITRGQMAAFLVRAFDYTDPGPGNLFIDDDGNEFERDIDRLATAGVTKGCNPPADDRYCPDQPVSRDQMASFLGRALELTPTVPPPRPTTSTTTSSTTSSTPSSSSSSSTTSSSTTSSTVPEDSVRFEMGSSSFIPTSYTVTGPVTVRWRNDSGVLHNVTSGSGPWPSSMNVDIPSGANEVEVTLTTPGVYTFFCRFHQALGMTGTVTVTG